LALCLAFWVAPRAYRHLITKIPAVQADNWNQILNAKKQELAVPWRDSRPLILLAGDSQIELGDWYNLFSGTWAVRNCGLSRAKIADVTQLISATGDVSPKMVVLMCGVNSLGDHETLDNCLRDYDELLTVVHTRLHPGSVMVLAVMPVRASAVDHASRQFNLNIDEFNLKLAVCCRQHQADFINANAALTDASGGLKNDLTADGLHLNQDGYRRLAGVIAAHLPPPELNP